MLPPPALLRILFSGLPKRHFWKKQFTLTASFWPHHNLQEKGPELSRIGLIIPLELGGSHKSNGSFAREF